MQQPEAFLPTAHAQSHDQGGLGAMPVYLPPPPQPQPRRNGLVLAAVSGGALLFGLLIGIAIGRATAEESVAVAPVATPTEVGHLAVASSPVDGNVTVDGRFVGVAPIERLDLDPGKHSIVIDAFGYQPYAGTLEIRLQGKVNLTVLLAAIGGGSASNGNITGGGKATKVVIPPSALLPATPDVGRSDAKGGTPRTSRRSDPVSSYTPPPAPAEPPPRPRRDCSGEKSRCRDSCSRAEGDCRFSCNGCVSCSSSVGWDECKRQCDTCRSSCDRNTKFCETTCDGQYDNCQSSQ
jgi:hypothetical protein